MKDEVNQEELKEAARETYPKILSNVLTVLFIIVVCFKCE